MTYTLTVYAADMGTPLKSGRPSEVGHMYYGLTNNLTGEKGSYGFGPEDGTLIDHGKLLRDDVDKYQNTNDNIHKKTIELTQDEYNKLKKFGEKPSSYGFDTDNYNVLTNSCVDFVWKALEVGGFNPKGFEGDLWPGNNIDDINNKFIRPSPIKDIQKLLNDIDSILSSDLLFSPDGLITVIKYVDPLVLDLNGDGLSISPLSSNIFFDADGDTIKTNTAWVKPTDGLLVFDRNNNGIIDNGGELFGDQTVMKDGKKAAHGFIALKELDTNQDNIFDNQDTLYNTVKVWQDLNQDGISQTNELSGLGNANVASININSQSVSQSWDREQYTNAILVEGSTFARTDGTTGKAGSFIFAQNYASQQFTPIIINQAVANLPDIKGSGFIRDLKEAATIDTHLINIFERLKNESSRENYTKDVGQLLRKWANNSEYMSASKKALTEGYGLILSNPLNAQEAGWMSYAIKASQADRDTYRATLNASDLVKFDAMRERMVGDLEKINTYEAFTGAVIYDWQMIKTDALNPLIRPINNVGLIPREVQITFREYFLDNRSASKSSQDGYILINNPIALNNNGYINIYWNRLVEDASRQLMLSTHLSKYIDKIQLNITSSGIVFDFSDLNSAIKLLTDTNKLEGNTLLLDLYRVMGRDLNNLGWNGQEQVSHLMLQLTDDTVSSLDKSNITRAFEVTGINIIQPNNSMYIYGTITDDFILGSLLNDNIKGNLGNDIINGGKGNDTISGGGGNDFIFGGDGNDTINGDAGNDNINGGVGDDSINGGEGNDSINGGKGDDTIYDSAGNDIYTFNLGDGKDTIKDYGLNTEINTLTLGVGISAANTKVYRKAYDLVLIFNDNDQITVSNYFYGNVYRIEHIKFADGTNWTEDYLKSTALEYRGTSASDYMIGWDGIEYINAGEGDDYIDGGANNDIINGEAGNDRIDGGTGNDTINGGEGNDSIDGGEGSDTINGSVGDDTIDGDAGNDTINGESGNDRIYAGEGNDTINGGVGDDIIDGDAGNDTINGEAGNDHIDGGEGNDTINGGVGDDTIDGDAGNDIYTFNLGDGKDTIKDYGLNTEIDTISLGVGISAANTKVYREAYNLVLIFNGNDQITVSNYFFSNNKIEHIKFADGTNWTEKEINQKFNQLPTGSVSIKLGTAALTASMNVKQGDILSASNTLADLDGLGNITYQWLADGTAINGANKSSITLNQSQVNKSISVKASYTDSLGTLEAVNSISYKKVGLGNDMIKGTANADNLDGGAGNDTLSGLAGNDIINGGIGNDILMGGLGIDRLLGGGGSDTYTFNKGDGKDTINDYDVSKIDTNKLKFGTDISSTGLTLKHIGLNLSIGINGTTDNIVWENFFTSKTSHVGAYNSDYRLDSIEFFDGTKWQLDTVAGMNSLLSRVIMA